MVDLSLKQISKKMKDIDFAMMPTIAKLSRYVVINGQKFGSGV